jgi:acetylornithine deacetylase/succinyl-diaminopimelate desuccinylase-like protein
MSVIELVQDLVRIDSVNPGLAEGGAGESEVAAFVAGWAREAGLLVETIEHTPGRPNVIVRGGRATGGRTLLLCGHLDTVGLSSRPAHSAECAAQPTRSAAVGEAGPCRWQSIRSSGLCT